MATYKVLFCTSCKEEDGKLICDSCKEADAVVYTTSECSVGSVQICSSYKIEDGKIITEGCKTIQGGALICSLKKSE